MEEQIVNKEVWINGELQSTEQVTLTFKSKEEQIADKEAQLLEMYAELEALKAQQNQ